MLADEPVSFSDPCIDERLLLALERDRHEVALRLEAIRQVNLLPVEVDANDGRKRRARCAA